MVTKNKTSEKKGKAKVGKLKVNKESVKDLTPSEEKQVKGGINATLTPTRTLATRYNSCGCY